MQGCITEVTQIDLDASKRRVIYRVGIVDTLLVMFTKSLHISCPVPLMFEFDTGVDPDPKIIYEVVTSDAQHWLTRKEFSVVDAASLQRVKHAFLLCTFDDGTDVTSYINARYQSFTRELAISAKDLHSVLELSKNHKVYPAVNKCIFRAIDGLTLDVKTFIENEHVVLVE